MTIYILMENSATINGKRERDIPVKIYTKPVDFNKITINPGKWYSIHEFELEEEQEILEIDLGELE